MSTEHQLVAEGLSVGYSDRLVVSDLDLVVPSGRITSIVGPNACGKSTLLRSLSRLLSPRAGRVLLDGSEVHRMPAKQLARVLGLLPQSPVAPEGITVGELVSRGRNPHHTVFRRWSAADDVAVAEALDLTATGELVDRAVDELSGGQRQRVWMAMALAQDTDVLLLDEPTTFLDVTHQVEVLDLLTELNRLRGTTVLMVLHDLNLAARYSDRLVAIADGNIHSAAPPAEVLTAAMVHDVFGMVSQVVTDPVSGGPLMVPVGRHHDRRARAADQPPPVVSPL